MEPHATGMLVEKLIEAAFQQGFAVLLMLAALIYIVRGNAGLIRALNKERAERLQQLENSARDCIEDRNRIHKDLKELWEKILRLPPANN